MAADFTMIQMKKDGKPQQTFTMLDGPTSSAEMARGLRNLAEALERSPQIVEAAVLTLTLQPYKRDVRAG